MELGTGCFLPERIDWNYSRTRRLSGLPAWNWIRIPILTKSTLTFGNAARYWKGYEMLERYEVKVSRTVLRWGGAGNRSLLNRHNPWNLRLRHRSIRDYPHSSRSTNPTNPHLLMPPPTRKTPLPTNRSIPGTRGAGDGRGTCVSCSSPSKNLKSLNGNRNIVEWNPWRWQYGIRRRISSRINLLSGNAYYIIQNR